MLGEVPIDRGIQPLSREQIRNYLKKAGKSLAGVRTVLQDDDTLWELLQTPLMLSIVALAYQGRSAAEVRATGSLEQQRTHLFENYTRRMFERRGNVIAYTREQILCWLTWLARSLMRNNLSVFYVEWMQPDWLPSRAQRWIVAIIPIIPMWLAAIGLVWLIFGLEEVLAMLEEPVWGLLGLLLGGLAIGLFWLFFGREEVLALFAGMEGWRWRNRIKPAEALRWSWRNVRWGLVGGLAFGLSSWLFTELFTGRLVFGLLYGLAIGLAIGLFGGLVMGGSAYLKHFMLRFLLWRNNYAPPNYIRFLDYAAERVFLRKVGGGYTFTHRLLMEYFATLQPPDQAGQTQSA